ncbi:MAG: hypothetical protein ACI4VK_03900 [Candidatus Coproplasma sp.]
MGLLFGKYFIYIEFEDGMKGFFMHKDGDHVMTTDTPQNSEKFMTCNGAINYFHDHNLGDGHNYRFSPIVRACVYSDGKYFRMD